MTVYATWIAADSRFAFDLNVGEHKLTDAQHMALINAESTGCILSPDAQTGMPIANARPAVPVSEEARTHYDRQLLAINLACEKQITSGFLSAALGAAFSYDSELQDQLNLTGAIQARADTTSYPCRNEQGIKEFRDHSIAQLQQVGDDFTLIKLRLLQKANLLKRELDAAFDALDIAAIDAVIWKAETE